MIINKPVLLMTSTNLASNPRCLKEVKLLADMGATVTLVAFELHNWTTEKEKEINNELQGVNFCYLEATSKSIFPWLLSSLLERAARLLLPFFPSSLFIAAMASSKRNWLLLNWCRQTKLKPELVIAHNPAAFYPAYKLAKKRSVLFALDIEDYHPGEGVNASSRKAAENLMTRLMPIAYYNSFASPLIKLTTERLISSSKMENNFVVNNLFSVTEFNQSNLQQRNAKLQLVWFSQFIDYGRGLEDILPLLDKKSDALELTLIGSLRQSFFIHEISSRQYIQCLASMPQKKMHLALSKYDVGLAVENSKSDINRDVCLTNKIWAYFQAGLYIIASDTSAQKKFIDVHDSHGVCFDLSSITASVIIDTIVNNKEVIRSGRADRVAAATINNWESESAILQDKWNAVLK